MHPLRLSYEWWSDRNPLAPVIADTAEKIREQRAPVNQENPFLQAQNVWSDTIVKTLNLWRDVRDDAYEKMFEWTYSSPWVQALAGQAGDDGPTRQQPSVSPEHQAFVTQEIAELHEAVTQGGALEAGIRAVFYIHRLCSSIDERRANLALELHQPDCGSSFDMEPFRTVVRRQANIMRLDANAAIAALPQLLAREKPARIREIAQTLERLRSIESLSSTEEISLTQMLKVFEGAATR